jgi:predicted SAM-dependent methyltransferase
MNNVRRPGERYGMSVGCGKEYRETTPEMTWVNVDADPEIKADVRWPVEALHTRYLGFFDVIEAKDVLEHIPYNEAHREEWLCALQSWCWCLAPGGTLKVQVPDLEAIMAQFHEGTIDFRTANRVIFGESTGPYDRHYQTFTLRGLRQTMEDFGLEITEAYNLHVCAIVVGRKR